MSSVIQGEFGWSNSPLIQGMGEAEVIAGRGAAKVQNKFLDIFKRSPNMRAERAFSGFLQSIASGDIAGGIEALSSRMTGLGIVAGVAIGAGVVIFQKFKEQIDATADAEKRLGLELAGLGGMRGPEELQKQFEKISAGMDEVRTKSETIGSRLGDIFSGDIFTGAGGKNKALQRQNELNSGTAAQVKLLYEQAGAEHDALEIKKAAVTLGERQAANEKILLDAATAKTAVEKDAQKFRGALPGRGLGLEEQTRLFNASKLSEESRKATIDADAQLQIDNNKKIVGLKEQALELEEKMQRLIHGGLSADDQKKVRASLELQMLDKQIGSEASPEKKRALILQRGQKENEIRSMKPAEQSNPFAAGTIAARDWESDQGGFGSIAARSKETEDKGAFGSLANASALRGDVPVSAKKVENQEVVDAIKESTNVMREAWLKK